MPEIGSVGTGRLDQALRQSETRGERDQRRPVGANNVASRITWAQTEAAQVPAEVVQCDSAGPAVLEGRLYLPPGEPAYVT